MRQRKSKMLSVLATAFAAAMPVTQALADPPVAPTVIDKPSHGVAVPRSFPDLVPYWNFDPPKSPLFDVSKFTLSGDMRVRGESRTNGNFAAAKADTFVQQWARLGLNYAISQDVDMFTQLQYSKNWGGNGTAALGNANDSSFQTNGNTVTGGGATNNNSLLGVRQAFIIIRNLGVDGLSLKVGRQLVVMGNHRLFGHFDWNNQAFSHDGVTFQYNQPTYEVWGGWLHAGNTDAQNSGAAAGAVTSAAGGGQNADILFTRVAFKPMAGLAIEPLWVWQNNKNQTTAGTQGGVATVPHAPGQSRHTLGGRVAYRQDMFDGTFESYWQTGHFDAADGRNVSINAVAMAIEGGVTFKDLPMNPRIGAEFNYASGDGSGQGCNTSTTGGTTACQGNANTFENLYPTNHIVMGYADRMAWRNMVGYSGSLQLNPTQQTHLETRYWVFRKANQNDCWYTAAQTCQGAGSAGVTTDNSLYKELDVIFTMFFKNNKVAWQTGGAYLWAGKGMDQIVSSAQNGTGARNSTWMYSQLQVNF